MSMIPESFWQLQKNTPGWDESLFRQMLDKASPVSLRVNSRKFNPSITVNTIPWCMEGIILAERPLFAADPYWHAGAYYVQEANSMFSGYLVSQLELPDAPVVLDLCAAPGGKSTHLATVLPEDALLVSNEVIQARVSILNENLTKWGRSGLITHNDPSHFQKLTGIFDLIVVDAPCSGEGLFRRDPESVKEWSPENVQLCCERQQRILAQIWPALKEGGILLYSTCTYNTREDEENVQWLLAQTDAEMLDIPIPDSWKIHRSGKGLYKFFPWQTPGEGFFAAAFRKTSEESTMRSKVKGFTKLKGTHPMAAWIGENLTIIEHKERTLAIPSDHEATIELLTQHLKVTRCGLEVGMIKGKDLIPSAELAFSTDFKKRAFECLPLSYNQAIAYLRKDLQDIENTANGWKVVEFENMPLGFVKKIGNRINNYFPQEWRLRMQVETPVKLWWAET